MSLEDNHSISYQNDMQYSYMVTKLQPEDEIIEYQVRMIQENPAQPLLPFHKKQLDDELYIFYNITSKITLSQLLKRKKLNKYDFLLILKNLVKALKLSKVYLLQEGSFLLHSNYIYIDPATLGLSLAYIPIDSDIDINEAVKTLILDLLIYKVSFEKPAEGEFAYELLNLLKGEDFSLNQLDKLLNSISLQSGKSNGGKLPQPVQPAVGSDEKSDLKSNINPLLLLIQLFFIAFAALMIRYYYLQKGAIDSSAGAGIIIIAAALDIFTTKRLRLAENINLSFLKDNKSMIKSKQKIVQTPEVERLAAPKETAEQITPVNIDTKVLLGDMPAAPYLVSCDKNEYERIYIDKPSFIIGRLKLQADYVSENSAVGKLHAEIISKEGKYYIKDLNSRNGTYINGERIVSNVEHSIQNNDRIAFANSEFMFRWS